jgi:hypothetical protein
LLVDVCGDFFAVSSFNLAAGVDHDSTLEWNVRKTFKFPEYKKFQSKQVFTRGQVQKGSCSESVSLTLIYDPIIMATEMVKLYLFLLFFN